MPTPKKPSKSAVRANKSVGKPMPWTDASSPPKVPPAPVTAGEKSPKKGVKAPETGGNHPFLPPFFVPEGFAEVATIDALPDDHRCEGWGNRFFYELGGENIVHATIVHSLGINLMMTHGGRPGKPGWIIVMRTTIHPSLLDKKNWLEPDLCGWYFDEVPMDWAMETASRLPDWICEVLSPSTWKHDLGAKAFRYADWGIPWLWMVHPTRKQIGVFKRFKIRNGPYAYRLEDSFACRRKTVEPFGRPVLEPEAVWPTLPQLSDAECRELEAIPSPLAFETLPELVTGSKSTRIHG